MRVLKRNNRSTWDVQRKLDDPTTKPLEVSCRFLLAALVEETRAVRLLLPHVVSCVWSSNGQPLRAEGALKCWELAKLV